MKVTLCSVMVPIAICHLGKLIAFCTLSRITMHNSLVHWFLLFCFLWNPFHNYFLGPASTESVLRTYKGSPSPISTANLREKSLPPRVVFHSIRCFAFVEASQSPPRTFLEVREIFLLSISLICWKQRCWQFALSNLSAALTTVWLD